MQIVRSASPLEEDIKALLRAIENNLQNRPNTTEVKFIFHLIVEDDLNVIDLTNKRLILFRCEMVDDRIREVENKEDVSQRLFHLTNSNCVWVFFCYKPTLKQDSASIANTLKGIDFKSGYTATDGTEVNLYLKYEYQVKSEQKDKMGNFQHVLLNRNKIVDDIIDVILSIL